MKEFALSDRSRAMMALYEGDKAYFFQGVAITNAMIGHVARMPERVAMRRSVYDALGARACADNLCGSWDCTHNADNFTQRHRLNTSSAKAAFQEGVDSALDDYFSHEAVA